MTIILVILILILLYILIPLKENMGSMHPNHYYVILDLEYLSKNNALSEDILKFMEDNYSTAKLFFGNNKVNIILVKSNEANLYNINRLEAIYPNSLEYHFPKSYLHLKELVKDKTILYLADKEIENSGLDNRFLNMERQMNYFKF